MGNRPMSRFAAVSASTLQASVPSIIGRGAEPKMIWANTGRIVTMMEDPEPFRYRPDEQAVRDNMRTVFAHRSFVPSASANCPVTILIECCGPQPTRRSFLNLRPEAVRDWDGTNLGSPVVAACPRAEPLHHSSGGEFLMAARAKTDRLTTHRGLTSVVPFPRPASLRRGGFACVDFTTSRGAA